jgi:hypothetical protein
VIRISACWSPAEHSTSWAPGPGSIAPDPVPPPLTVRFVAFNLLHGGIFSELTRDDEALEEQEPRGTSRVRWPSDHSGVLAEIAYEAPTATDSAGVSPAVTPRVGPGTGG